MTTTRRTSRRTERTRRTKGGQEVYIKATATQPVSIDLTELE